MTSSDVLPTRPKGRPKAVKGKAQDEQIMGTNSSSIVSKRSVEKLYYPNEPHFFRFFVKKFQRRAPLINRGYYLRLHAIDSAVRTFLQAPRGGKQKKVVVNLGCGSDVLPWQCMTRYPESCRDAIFVDVDFPDLMRRKRETVLNTPELSRPLAELEVVDDSPVLLRSRQYYQLGCDLGHVQRLEDALAKIVDISASSVLFVAEVSITYMETEAADALIRWASALGDSTFYLLEQILPDGPDHPFAATMLSHFEKLNTPLKSVRQYPTLRDQALRFSHRGWASVDVRSLWEAWADDDFLAPAERRRLDAVEPFDEWEEFALFGCHYCVVHATRERASTAAPAIPEMTGQSRQGDVGANGLHAEKTKKMEMSYRENLSLKGRRRFGAAMALENPLGERFIANVMGSPSSGSRLSSTDIYREYCNPVVEEVAFGPNGPVGRVCHTLTEIGPDRVLLAGGRTSPVSPQRDCWLFHRGEARWEKTHNLPLPLYRQSVARLPNSSLGLLIGGKTGSSAVFGGCLLFHPERGWIECRIVGEPLQPVFGASFICMSREVGNTGTRYTGILAGGITEDGVVARQLRTWRLDLADMTHPSISFENSDPDPTICQSPLSRFGASTFFHAGSLILVGGIANGHLLSQDEEIVEYKIAPGQYSTRSWVARSHPASEDSEYARRPLLIGHSAVMSECGTVDVVGGGATCFSFGTAWATGTYSFDPMDLGTTRAPPAFHRTVAIVPEVETARRDDGMHSDPDIRPVPGVSITSRGEFETLLRSGRPVILQGLSLGPCIERWSLDAIADKAGRDRQVVVHESPTLNMDFNAKNFRYVTKTFGEFSDDVKGGGRLYLRALSAEEPASRPANLEDDFPALASDFVLPPQLAFVAENTFSSVLRVSGPVNMWLHYDVMANVYCQVTGSKRLVLFPPSDVQHLGFAPGTSSSGANVFAEQEGAAARLSGIPHSCHPHEAVLSAGDILFLPPLWPHAATPTSDASIAVNVFFRDMEGSGAYSAGRDVYGNRDLAAYEKGRRDVARIADSFGKLPAQAREFYLLRLADELRNKAGG